MSDTKPTREVEVRTLAQTNEFAAEFGVIKLEEWPEGLVLWVGGEIRWRSWCDPALCAVRKA